MVTDADAEADAHYGFIHRFAAGMNSRWNGRDVIISHVQISRGNLRIHLKGHGEPVPSESVEISMTALTGPGFRKRL